MKTILCYGDSNTWGCPPVQPGQNVERYGPDVRWGSVLRTALGPGYWVVEEGLSGFAELFAGAGEKSGALAAHYRREAELRGCALLDAGQIISSSERDGIHFEADAHQALGHAVARLVRELLGA